MPPITPPQQLSAAILLRDLKMATQAVKEENAEVQKLLKRAGELLEEINRIETEISNARTQVFQILVEQVKQSQITHAEQYLAALEAAAQP